MKVAVSVDSNSGMAREEGERAGIHILPMPFMLDGTIYHEDVDLTKPEFYEKLAQGAEISTSQPSPDAVLSLWEGLLHEHDQVVHIPMSSGLSSSYQTAALLAEDFEGRVGVVDNHRVSVTQRQSALEAVAMAGQGMDAADICRVLEGNRFESGIYLMVDTLRYLKKGGRITPAAAALGTLLRLKPVLGIFGEKLDAFAKARTVRQARSIMITAVQRDLQERYGGKPGEMAHLQVAHSNCPELAQDFREEVSRTFEGADVYVDELAMSIACHTGPGTLALAWTKKLDMG